MAVANYDLLVDWDNDGDFLDTGEDVTARTWRISTRSGRDFGSQLTGRAIAGTLRAVLNNESGDYSSFNTASPLAGNILPGRKVQLRMTPPFGYYLDFDGVDDDVTVTDDAAIQNIFDSGGTVEFLIDGRSDGEGNAGRVLEKRSGGWLVNVQNEVAGKVRLRLFYDFSTAVGRWSTTVRDVSLNKWTRCAITYNADDVGNDPIIYIEDENGAMVAVAITEDTTPVGTRGTDVGQDLVIGNNAGQSSSFDGSIDDVRLWNDIRTAQEISANKDKELVGNETGLVGYWRFDEGTGTTAADATANNNDGTISGATWKHAILWTGFLESLEPQPGVSSANQAVLRAIGPLGYLNQFDVDLPMSTSIGTGAAATVVLDETTWPVGDRTIDTGQTTIDRIFLGEQKTLTALRAVEATEAGFIRETPDGKIAFEDRHHRLKMPHFTSQATFSDAPAAARVYGGIRQEDPLPHIVNVFEAQVRVYAVGSLATLWALPESGADSPSIEAGESRDFWASYPNPVSASDAVAVDAWTTPVVTTDYTANSQAGGGGDDHSADIVIAVSKFGTTMKITMTNNAAVKVFITLLQARGTPITVSDPVLVKSEDSASQTAFGKRTYRNPSQFLPDTGEAQAWCDFNLAIFKDPLPILSLRVNANRDATHITEVKTRDVSDRITVVAANNAGLGINEDFFIEAVDHEIDNRNRFHVTEYTLSQADGFSGYWVLGKSKLGLSTRLAY